jgi:hypothetical protein
MGYGIVRGFDGEGFEVMVVDLNSNAEEARLLFEDGDEGGW